jgi:hypothetical protein
MYNNRFDYTFKESVQENYEKWTACSSGAKRFGVISARRRYPAAFISKILLDDRSLIWILVEYHWLNMSYDMIADYLKMDDCTIPCVWRRLSYHIDLPFSFIVAHQDKLIMECGRVRLTIRRQGYQVILGCLVPLEIASLITSF